MLSGTCVRKAFRVEPTACKRRLNLINSSSTWTIPVSWLLQNDASACHATGQRKTTLAGLAQPVDKESTSIESSRIAEDGSLECEIKTASSSTTVKITQRNLERYATRSPLNDVQVMEPQNLCKIPFSTLGPEMLDLESNQVKNTSQGVVDLVTALVRDGIAVVTECPESEDSVLSLGRVLNPPLGVMHTLYAKSWKVAAEKTLGAIKNIAYTGEYLELHNDLAYYESMPGLQLLHCQRFEKEVQGGESFFTDAFGAAKELRDTNPSAFKTLCEVPACFMKDDPGRPVPALYYFSCPHISVVPNTQVVRKVVWAPAFECPQSLGLGVERLEEYSEAYRAFAGVLNRWRTSGKEVRFRLQPGETVIFNQTRVLHGREAFTEPEPGMRRLHGGYVNLDDFRNRAENVLLQCPTGLNHLRTTPLGNSSWF